METVLLLIWRVEGCAQQAVFQQTLPNWSRFPHKYSAAANS